MMLTICLAARRKLYVTRKIKPKNKMLKPILPEKFVLSNLTVGHEECSVRSIGLRPNFVLKNNGRRRTLHYAGKRTDLQCQVPNAVGLCSFPIKGISTQDPLLTSDYGYYFFLFGKN